MDGKPAFDPSQPFEPVAEKPLFADPTVAGNLTANPQDGQTLNSFGPGVVFKSPEGGSYRTYDNPNKPQEKPPFDPLQPFEAAQAQGAREAAAASVRGPRRPQYARQEDPSWGDVGKVVTQTATGANEGLSSTVLRAADAVPYFVNRAMGGPGVHPLEGTFNDTFVKPVPEPSTDPQRIGRAGGHMLGANLENIVPVQAAANSGVRAGVTMAEQAAPGIANKVRGASDAVLDWMAKNPGKAFVSDNAGAMQAGAGGEFAREAAEDSGASPRAQQGAELAGQMFTPAAMAAYSKVSPTAVVARTGTKAAKAAIGSVPEGVLPESLQPAGGTAAERKAESLAYANREGRYENPTEPPPKEPNFVQRAMDAGAEARTEKAKDVVGKQFNDITSQPEAAANLAETNRLKAEIPGFEPGVAKATGDPALLNKQKSFEASATGDELRQRQSATDASRGAVREYMDNTVPPAEAPRRSPEQVGPLPATDVPQDSVAAANAARVNRVEGRIGEQRAGVEDQIRARSQALPEVDRAATGQTLREVRHGEQAAADAEVTRLRGAIANPETPIQVGDQTMTVNQALDRRAAINQETRRYASANQRNVEDVRAMEALGAERDALDAALGRVNNPGMQEYTNYYRNEYAPRFLEGPSRDVGRYSQTGIDKNRVQSEDVPGAFFKPNNISEARQFNRLYGEGTAPETATARQAMTDYALDDLRHAAVDPNTGMIREGAVNRWLQKNERILNEMPWIREEVNTRNPDDLYRRLGQLDRRQGAVGDTKVASLLGKNPEQHIDAALNDWQVMKGLRGAVRGDAQAEAALTRSVWDRATAATGKDTLVDADGLQKWIDGHRRSLAQVLTPQHLNNLETVIRAARVEGQLPRPTGAAEKTKNAFSSAEEVVGTSIPSAGATVSALARGRSSPVYEVPRVLMNFYRGMSEREANAIWKEALYNPKVANQLTVAAKGGVATPLQLTRMHNYMLTVGEEDARK